MGAPPETPFLHTKTQVARGLICTHGIFVAGQKSNRQRWMKACREVGEVLRLLVRAMDEERLEGEDVTRYALSSA